MAITTDRPSMTVAVVTEVAKRKGIDPSDLEQALGDVVDTETLNSIGQFDAGSVQFEYAGFLVTACTDGSVELEEPS